MRKNFIHSLFKQNYHGFNNFLPRIRNERFENNIGLFSQNLYGHFGCVNAVEFSHGGDDRRILLWNIEETFSSNIEPLILSAKHNSNIFCIGFDSQTTSLFSSGNDEQVIHHDLIKNTAKNVFLFEDAVYSLSIHPLNDDIFCVACEDGQVLMSDARVATSYTSPFHSVMYHPLEHNYLVTANTKEGVGFWDIRKPGSCLYRYGCNVPNHLNSPQPNYPKTTPLRDPNQNVMCAKFNYNGKFIMALFRRRGPELYLSNDHIIKKGHSFNDHSKPVKSFASFSQEDRLSYYLNNPLCSFDYATYYNSCTMKSGCFAGQNDQYVVSGSDDFNVYVWKIPDAILDYDIFQSSQFINDINVVKDPFYILKSHRSIVNQTRFNRYRNILVSTGVEKIIKVWSPDALGLKDKRLLKLGYIEPYKSNYQELPFPSNAIDTSTTTYVESNAANGNYDSLTQSHSIPSTVDINQENVENYGESTSSDISLPLGSRLLSSTFDAEDSIDEDPGMLVFFDSLLQHELEGWDSSSTSSSSSISSLNEDVVSSSSSSTSSQSQSSHKSVKDLPSPQLLHLPESSSSVATTSNLKRLKRRKTTADKTRKRPKTKTQNKDDDDQRVSIEESSNETQLLLNNNFSVENTPCSQRGEAKPTVPPLGVVSSNSCNEENYNTFLKNVRKNFLSHSNLRRESDVVKATDINIPNDRIINNNNNINKSLNESEASNFTGNSGTHQNGIKKGKNIGINGNSANPHHPLTILLSSTTSTPLARENLKDYKKYRRGGTTVDISLIEFYSRFYQNFIVCPPNSYCTPTPVSCYNSNNYINKNATSQKSTASNCYGSVCSGANGVALAKNQPLKRPLLNEIVSNNNSWSSTECHNQNNTTVSPHSNNNNTIGKYIKFGTRGCSNKGEGLRGRKLLVPKQLLLPSCTTSCIPDDTNEGPSLNNDNNNLRDEDRLITVPPLEPGQEMLEIPGATTTTSTTITRLNKLIVEKKEKDRRKGEFLRKFVEARHRRHIKLRVAPFCSRSHASSPSPVSVVNAESDDTDTDIMRPPNLSDKSNDDFSSTTTPNSSPSRNSAVKLPGAHFKKHFRTTATHHLRSNNGTLPKSSSPSCEILIDSASAVLGKSSEDENEKSAIFLKNIPGVRKKSFINPDNNLNGKFKAKNHDILVPMARTKKLKLSMEDIEESVVFETDTKKACSSSNKTAEDKDADII